MFVKAFFYRRHFLINGRQLCFLQWEYEVYLMRYFDDAHGMKALLYLAVF